MLQELSLENLLPMAFEGNDEFTLSTLAELKEAKRVGMKAQIKRHKMRLIAKVLERKNMCLIKADNTEYGDWIIGKISSKNGEIERIETPNNRYWRRTKLSRFSGNIPAEIASRLPDNSAKKAWVFYPKSNIDPILAVKLKHGLYAALFRWE